MKVNNRKFRKLYKLKQLFNKLNINFSYKIYINEYLIL